MRFFALIVFIFVPVLIYGQYTISGTVEESTGEVLSGARLTLYSSSEGQKMVTVSSEVGAYRFEGVENGQYFIEISESGNTTVEYDQVTVYNKDVTHRIVVRKVQELNEVVVSVESVKSKLEKEGFAVNVIETEEAAVRNIQTNELLNRTVGVKVRQNGGMGSRTDYNLNGMSGNSVKIFINGIPMSSYGASFDLNSLSPALIERIEVYKGVVPGELADDALGGAINILLKDDVASGLNASVSYGSFNTFQGSLQGVYNAKNSNFYLRGSAFYNYSDNDYKISGKFVRNILPNGRYDYVTARRFNDAYRSVGGMVEAGYRHLKWADDIRLGITVSDQYNEVQHGTYMTIPYKGRFVDADAKVVNLSYKKNDVLKGLDVYLYGLYSQRNTHVTDTVPYNYNWYGEISRDLNGNPIYRPDGAQQGAPTLGNIRREIFSLRGGAGYSINEHHRLILNHFLYDISREEDDDYLTGLQRDFIGTRNLIKNVTSFTYELRANEDKLKTSLFGKYYQQKVNKMDPEIERIEGEDVRVEKRFSKSTDEWGYGVAASYLVFPALAVLSSTEKAVRLPAENEIFGDIGVNIVQNSGLKAERSNNLNVGFKAGLYRVKKHQFSLGVNGFIRDTKDKIVRQTHTNLNDAIQTAGFENLGKTQSKGVDAELRYIYDNKLEVLANFSRFDTRYKSKYDHNGKVLALYNVQIPSQPFMTANVNASYRLKDVFAKRSSLNLFYNFNFVDSFYNIWVVKRLNGHEDFRVPQQYIHDFGVSYVFPDQKMTISVDVKNFTDAHAYDNFAVLKPGRAVYVKLNYSI